MMYLLQSDVRSSWEGEVGGQTEGRKRSRMFVGKFKSKPLKETYLGMA